MCFPYSPCKFGCKMRGKIQRSTPEALPTHMGRSISCDRRRRSTSLSSDQAEMFFSRHSRGVWKTLNGQFFLSLQLFFSEISCISFNNTRDLLQSLTILYWLNWLSSELIFTVAKKFKIKYFLCMNRVSDKGNKLENKFLF